MFVEMDVYMRKVCFYAPHKGTMTSTVWMQQHKGNRLTHKDKIKLQKAHKGHISFDVFIKAALLSIF